MSAPALPRVALYGSRSWKRPELIGAALEALEERLGRFVVVFGDHHEGADAMIREQATSRELPLDPYPADWDRYKSRGRRNPAGQIRNERMAKSGLAAAVGFRSPGRGRSPGSDGMSIDCMENGVVTIVIPERFHVDAVRRLLGPSIHAKEVTGSGATR